MSTKLIIETFAGRDAVIGWISSAFLLFLGKLNITHFVGEFGTIVGFLCASAGALFSSAKLYEGWRMERAKRIQEEEKIHDMDNDNHHLGI